MHLTDGSHVDVEHAAEAMQSGKVTVWVTAVLMGGIRRSGSCVTTGTATVEGRAAKGETVEGRAAKVDRKDCVSFE